MSVKHIIYMLPFIISSNCYAGELPGDASDIKRSYIKAADDITKELRSGGMSSVVSGISECYAKLNNKFTDDMFRYCFSKSILAKKTDEEFNNLMKTTSMFSGTILDGKFVDKSMHMLAARDYDEKSAAKVIYLIIKEYPVGMKRMLQNMKSRKN